MGEDELIRERAHAIWLAEGSPDGRHDQHWRQATEELVQARAEARGEPEPVDPVPPVPEPPREPQVATSTPKPRRRKAT